MFGAASGVTVGWVGTEAHEARDAFHRVRDVVSVLMAYRRNTGSGRSEISQRDERETPSANEVANTRTTAR
jgi:hypothetical protein